MISFNGLATGLDTSALITQLVKAESAPIERITSKQVLLDAKSRKLTSLRTKLDDVRNAALALDSRAEALPTSVTSSDESVVKARGSGGSTLGRFDLTVERLATSARVYSSSFVTRDAPGSFGTGTLTLDIGGSSYAIDVDASDTLDSVTSKIQASGAPVTTGILFDGTGYRLQVSGRATGAANALTIDEGGLTLGLSQPANMVAQATDARLRIDGFLITRGTNTVSDAIPGVTLELKGTSAVGTTQSIEVGHDTDALAAGLSKLVDAYNAVNTFIAAEVSWSGSSKPADSLSGDATVRSIQARLRTALLSPVAGTTGAFTTLASLGVSIQRTGALSLDKAKLTAALGSDPEAVARVLGSSGSGAMTIVAQEADYFSSSTTGVLTQRLTSMSRERKSLDDRITQMQARLDKYEAQLRQTYATLEQTVSGLQNQGSQLSAAMNALNQ